MSHLEPCQEGNHPELPHHTAAGSPTATGESPAAPTSAPCRLMEARMRRYGL